jgi:mono/diheme cytochrome c family protein
MPPFVSLSDQERWDVVAYAMTFHMTEQELAKGQELFETNCVNCSTDFFTDQSKMAELSEVELARIIREGNDQVPAFGATLSEDDLWAVTSYLRILSFDTAPVAAAPAASVTAEPASGIETPVEGTPLGTEAAPATDEPTALARAGFGTVSGTVENKTGSTLPSDLKVTLRGYEHGADPNTGAQEVFSQQGTVNEDGSFAFEDVEIPANRIFIAAVTYDGIDLQSDFAIVKEGDTSVSLPTIPLYGKTEDTSGLVIDEARIFLEYGTDGIQVFNVYSFRNAGDETILVTLDELGQVPFFKSPEGTSGFGYETMQDAEKFQQTSDGFAIPPSERSYGLIAFGSMAKAKEFKFTQEFILPAASVTVFVPEGVNVEGTDIADLGVQAIQNFNFHVYELGSLSAGEKVQLTVSGTPKETTSTSAPAETTSNQNLLIGAGALGIGLILAGGWMYLRDRNRRQPDGEEDEDEFESSEDVIDAILALDDLHRSKKISDAAYQNRRAQLKEILKDKM